MSSSQGAGEWADPVPYDPGVGGPEWPADDGVGCKTPRKWLGWKASWLSGTSEAGPFPGGSIKPLVPGMSNKIVGTAC
jgi:hypothetical protein